MSTTSTGTYAQTPADDDLAPPSVEPLQRLVRLIGPAALGLGAVLAAAGLALHLGAMPEDERLTQAIADDPNWAVSHVLLGIGLGLVATGAAHAVTVVRGRGAVPAGIGAVLMSLGAMLMALSDVAHGALGLALRGHVGAGQSLEIHRSYFEHPAILGLNTGPILLTLGMIALGLGLVRSPAVPRPSAVAFLATPFAVNASFALRLPPFLQALPFLIGMLVLAGLMTRRSGAVTSGSRAV